MDVSAGCISIASAACSLATGHSEKASSAFPVGFASATGITSAAIVDPSLPSTLRAAKLSVSDISSAGPHPAWSTMAVTRSVNVPGKNFSFDSSTIVATSSSKLVSPIGAMGAKLWAGLVTPAPAAAENVRSSDSRLRPISVELTGTSSATQVGAATVKAITGAGTVSTVSTSRICESASASASASACTSATAVLSYSAIALASLASKSSSGASAAGSSVSIAASAENGSGWVVGSWAKATSLTTKFNAAGA